MHVISRALLASFVVLACSASSASAITVSVKTVDPFGTPTTTSNITLPGSTVTKDGNPDHTCAENTAASAIEAGTGGDWTGRWFDFGPGTEGYQADTVRGSTLAFGENNMYWGFYIDAGSGPVFQNLGICTTSTSSGNPSAIQSGDSIQLLPDCGAAECRYLQVPSGNLTLGATITARVGKTVAGSFPSTSAESGATVSGGGATATTGADGRASLVLNQRGSVQLTASRVGSSATHTRTVCVTDGADGFCGTSVPSSGGGGSTTTTTTPTSTTPAETTPAPAADAPPATTAPAPAPAPDRTAPRVEVDGVTDGKTYTRENAPREFKGTAGQAPAPLLRALAPDPSGIQSVKLRLTRNDAGKCSAYSGTKERFVKRGCGAEKGWWFEVSKNATWSYLLPFRLPRGRYVLDVKAFDRAGNVDEKRRRGTNRIVFRVR